MNKVVYPIKEIEGRLKLKIPLRVRNPINGKEFSIMALLDTGADTCTFPSIISRTLGLVYNDESRKDKGTKGISG
ncbi:MAG: hypothetical protein ACPG44_03295 [Polaribacter sp.]